MLTAELLRHVTIAFSSRILLVKKKEDNWRLRMDSRVLNHNWKNNFPLTTVKELID